MFVLFQTILVIFLYFSLQYLSAVEQSSLMVINWSLCVMGPVECIVHVYCCRLTESGLSITQWNLLKGMKPPRLEQEWLDEFEQYKKFPEYRL